MDIYYSSYFKDNFNINKYFNIDKTISKGIILDEFLEYWKGIKQRDESWYKLMYTTVGGSELAAILSKNKYKSRNDVIDEKVKLIMGENNFDWSAACTWGIIFEDVLGFCYEKIFNTTIKGDNICIQIYDGHRNSPDGFSILNIGVDGDIITDDNNIVDEIIVLLEFKCPYARTPTKIPIHYEVQVQSGLGVAPIADIGLYVDALFKTCSYNQLKSHGYTNYNKYCKQIEEKLIITHHNYLQHNKIIEKQKIYDREIIYGIIGVFLTSDNDFSNIIDYGTVDQITFENMLKMVDSKEYYIERNPIYDIDLKKWKLKRNFIGYIPWKLYKMDITLINRDNSFMNIVMPYIKTVHDEIIEKVDKLKKHVNTVQKEIENIIESDIALLY